MAVRHCNQSAQRGYHDRVCAFSADELTIRIERAMSRHQGCSESNGRHIRPSCRASLLIAYYPLAITLCIQGGSSEATNSCSSAAIDYQGIGGGVMIDLFMIIPNIPCDQQCVIVIRHAFGILLRRK